MRLKLLSVLILTIAAFAFDQKVEACTTKTGKWEKMMADSKYDDARKFAKSHYDEIAPDGYIADCQHYMIALPLYKPGKLDEAILEMATIVFDKNNQYINPGNYRFGYYSGIGEALHDYAH